jgi:hypothetical protein
MSWFKFETFNDKVVVRSSSAANGGRAEYDRCNYEELNFSGQRNTILELF